MSGDFQLQRDSFGHLVFIAADGGVHPDVSAARAFPITAPSESTAIIGRDGHELAWIPQLDALPAETRLLVEEELQTREFMPEIRSVSGVSGYATPCTWHVETDRGATSFVLNTEEDIRRLTAPALLIVDNRSIQFLIRDRNALDDTSRRILDRFL